MLSGSTDLEKLHDLSTYTYKNQAIWFLNSIEKSIFEKDAEKVWGYVKKFSQLDLDKKAEGSGLDEMNAHRFLESIGETLTVTELRNSLRGTGAIGQTERPKTVPLIQILLYKYQSNISWKDVVNAVQGDNQNELIEAQRLLDQVNALFEEARSKADAAATALTEAETAQTELQASQAELKSQEDTFNNKTNTLKSKSEDESVSVVGRNKAKNELAQHLASDPLPLRKAKITNEAAVKKAEKTRAAAEIAKTASDKALADAQAKVQEAEEYLNKVKKRPGVAQGAIWWIQRELEESKKYVPEKKGGVRKVDTHQ